MPSSGETNTTRTPMMCKLMKCPITSNTMIETVAYSDADLKPSNFILRANSTTLESVLRDEKSSLLFEEHLKKEHGIESLYFLNDVGRWETGFFDMPESTRLARANKIFSVYIQNTGEFTVNLSSKVVENLTEKLKQEDVSIELFEDAVKEIKSMLVNDSFARFVFSEAFIRTIKLDDDGFSIGSESTRSSASSRSSWAYRKFTGWSIFSSGITAAN